MKVLVTGGAGFIGSNLCDFLIQEGVEVLVVDDLSSGKKVNISGIIRKLTFFEEKLEEFDFNKCQGIDAVIHLAAQASVPLSISEFKASSVTNLVGTVKVINYCSQQKIPFIYASSSAIYGGLPLGDDVDTKIDLLSPYATDKYVMELYAETAQKIYNLSSIGLRFFNVYGPRQDPGSPYSGVISIFVDRLLNSKNLEINGGDQTRDFVYVGDVVRLIYQSLLMALKNNICDQINILTGTSISIDSLADLLISKIAPDVSKNYGELPLGDPEQSNGTIDKMKKLLHVDLSRLIKLEEGLKLTIEFIKREEK
jgi:nucleoside-diphosphate-sugar epimerase